jgi:hypothetical protein
MSAVSREHQLWTALVCSAVHRRSERRKTDGSSRLEETVAVLETCWVELTELIEG